jgi:hypothetical protein
MSGLRSGQPPGFERSPALLESWFDSWRFAHAAGWDYLEALWGLRGPQRPRHPWLTEAKQRMAEHLRSETFLELMRVNLSTMAMSARFMSPSHSQQEKNL